MFRLFNQLAPTLPPANSAALFKAGVENKTSPGIWQQIVGKLESKAAATTRFSCDVCLDHKTAGAAFGAAAHLHLQRLAGKITERGSLSLSASAAWRLRRSVSSNIHLKNRLASSLVLVISKRALFHSRGWASFCHHTVLTPPGRFTSSGWADNIHLITPCGSAVEAGVGRLTVHSAPAEESRALCCLSQRHAVLFSLWLLLLLRSAATPAFASALFFPFLPDKYFDFILFLLNEYHFSPLCPILLL